MTDKQLISKLRKIFDKWITDLGLGWWEINMSYYTDAIAIIDEFGGVENNFQLMATTDVRWMYGKALIKVNVPAFRDTADDVIEAVVIHELVHILVNEMREEEHCHEERVVTQLQKAFVWVRDATERDTKKAMMLKVR